MLNLKPILEKHPEWINDSRKLRAALNDYYPKNRREIDLLIDVLDDGIVDQIKKCNKINDRNMKSFVTTLYNNHGIQSDLAIEAIKEWANVFSIPIILKKKVKGPKKKTNINSPFLNSIKKLIRTAVIVALVLVLFNASQKAYEYHHRNDLKPNKDSSDYVGEKYDLVFSELQESGFTDIDTMVLCDLEKSEENLVGTVYQVAIDGETKFYKSSWFAKDSHVKITYHEIDPNRKDDVQIPENYTDYEGMDYITVVKRFQASGFRNIEVRGNYDVGIFSKAEQYEVESVSVQGDNMFSAGTWVSPDINVVIIYHDKKSNKKKATTNIIITDADVILQYSSSDYKKKNYADVVKKLETEGFSNIKTKQIKDLSKRNKKKNGQTESVTIAGKNKFAEGEIFTKNSEIIVSYHTYKR